MSLWFWLTAMYELMWWLLPIEVAQALAALYAVTGILIYILPLSKGQTCLYPEEKAQAHPPTTHGFLHIVEPMVRGHRGQHQQLEGTKEVSPSETPIHWTTPQTQERQMLHWFHPLRDDNNVDQRTKHQRWFVRLRRPIFDVG